MTAVGVDPQPVVATQEDLQARVQAAEAEAALRAMTMYRAMRRLGFWTLNAAWSVGWAWAAMWLAQWLGWLPTPWS